MSDNSPKLARFDWAIKYLLRNKADFAILEGFLSELLGTSVKIISLLESETNQATEVSKVARVDLKTELADGEQVIIEVQCVRQWDFLSRMLFVVSSVIIDHLKKGEAYGRVPRVISVNIVYFDLGHGKDYIYKGTTQFKGIHFTDNLELGKSEKRMYPPIIKAVEDIYPQFYVLKVAQFKGKVQNKLDEWMYFFKQESVRHEFKAKGLKEAADTLDVLKLPTQERRNYDAFLMSLSDETSFIETHYGEGKADGIKEGRALGIEEGILKGKVDTARQMIADGLSLTPIAQYTGLLPDDIRSL